MTAQRVTEFRVTIPVEYCENDDLVAPAEARTVVSQWLCRALQHFKDGGFPVTEESSEHYAIGRIFVETLRGRKECWHVGTDLEDPDREDVL